MDIRQTQWRTSSFSGGSGNSCVEVALLADGVAVRDTKDRTRSARTFGAATWQAFLVGIRAGEFERE